MNQAQFARRMAVNQQTVSAWESGRYGASAETLIKLGNLASYPQCMFFWQRAGIDASALSDAASRRLREGGALQGGELMIRVPVTKLDTIRSQKPKGGEAGQAKEMLALPAALLPNAAATFCLRVRPIDGANNVLDMGPVLVPGDLVVVDSSETDFRELKRSGCAIAAEYFGGPGSGHSERGRLVVGWPTEDGGGGPTMLSVECATTLAGFHRRGASGICIGYRERGSKDNFRGRARILGRVLFLIWAERKLPRRKERK